MKQEAYQMQGGGDGAGAHLAAQHLRGLQECRADHASSPVSVPLRLPRVTV
jgi:hypothetical protein